MCIMRAQSAVGCLHMTLRYGMTHHDFAFCHFCFSERGYPHMLEHSRASLYGYGQGSCICCVE
jgi:hypothetical protein